MSAALVPELYVTDLPVSLALYQGILGFEIVYGRPEEKFAYIKSGSVEMMLEEPIERTWLTGNLERPFGRGVNFQIQTSDIHALYERCHLSDAKIFLPLETKTYARRDDTVSQTQFIVQDPDGYLIRLAQITPPTDDKIRDRP
ncbi:MAG: VOC family protein [Pseudomonadota bacterium]